MSSLQQTFVTTEGPLEDNVEEVLLSHEEYYQQLHDTVNQIDQHFVKTLAAHEKNFIKAYKGQMQKVEKELRFLKKKQAEQAGKLMKDDDITNLQSSIAWFKSEAVKLNQILEAQKKQMKTSKFRLRHDLKEAKYMEENLKETSRQNKLTILAYEKTQEQNDQLSKFFEDFEASQRVAAFDPRQDLPKSIDQFQQFVEPSNLVSYIGGNGPQVPDIAPMIVKLIEKHAPEEVDERVVKFFQVFDQNQKQLILERNIELQSLKAQNKKLLNRQAIEFTESSEMENLFLDSVDVCRKDVVKRQAELFISKHQHDQISQLKDLGISGQMLMDSVCTKKESLVYLFEQIFSSQRIKETQSLSSTTPLRNFKPKVELIEESESQRAQRIMKDPIEHLIMQSSCYIQQSVQNDLQDQAAIHQRAFLDSFTSQRYSNKRISSNELQEKASFTNFRTQGTADTAFKQSAFASQQFTPKQQMISNRGSQKGSGTPSNCNSSSRRPHTRQIQRLLGQERDNDQVEILSDKRMKSAANFKSYRVHKGKLVVGSFTGSYQ